MPVVPDEIHGIAVKLWDGTSIPKQGESCIRTAVGRAYYSAYHCAREALRVVYGDASYDVAHSTLANFMIGSGQPDLRVNGLLLKELIEARERADYQLSGTITHQFAESQVGNARDVLGQRAAIELGFRSLLPRKAPRR